MVYKLAALCFLLVLPVQQQVAAQTEADDATALLKIKTANPSNTKLSTWTGSAPCTGRWNLVTCSVSNRVTAVNLMGIGLTGTIPSLSIMNALATLALSNNVLSGTSRAGLMALCTAATGLQTLDISNNPKLTGKSLSVLQGLCLQGCMYGHCR
eukprot:GHRR01034792.1.p1 GENE.GHRR01034792.1~~GHRR01034792.1.p1  ORF type:complete len:162 (+),score=41.08 GHRR01034792.1:26-487(+)